MVVLSVISAGGGVSDACFYVLSRFYDGLFALGDVLYSLCLFCYLTGF